MINVCLVIGYGFTICQDNRCCASVICYFISCAILHKDGGIALETSSVKSVIRRCTGYGIKSTFIILTFGINNAGACGISGLVNTFCCPVLCPGKACIHIFVFILCRCCGRRSSWGCCRSRCRSRRWGWRLHKRFYCGVQCVCCGINSRLRIFCRKGCFCCGKCSLNSFPGVCGVVSFF